MRGPEHGIGGHKRRLGGREARRPAGTAGRPGGAKVLNPTMLLISTKIHECPPKSTHFHSSRLRKLGARNRFWQNTVFGQIGTVFGRNWRIRRRIASGIRKKGQNGPKTTKKVAKI